MGQNHHQYCNQKQGQINQLQTQIKQITQNLNAIIVQKNGQVDQLNKLKQVISQRDANIQQLTQQLNKTSKETNQQISNLSVKQKQKDEQCQQLIQENLHLAQRNQDLLEEMQKLKNKIYSESNGRDINSDLVAYFPFNNANAIDATGHKNNGMIHNATSVDDRFHSEDNAFYFDGNAFIKGNAARFPKDERTISIWFKPDNLKDISPLFSYGGNQTLSDIGWEMRIKEKDGAPYAEVLASKDKKQVSFGGRVVLNARSSKYPWNNLVATTSYNNGTRLYLNGDLVNTENRIFISNTFVYGTDYFIGKSHFDGQKFKGVVDEIRVYDRELSAKEIAQLQKAPKVQLKKHQDNDVVRFFSPSTNRPQLQNNSVSEKLDAAFNGNLCKKL